MSVPFSDEWSDAVATALAGCPPGPGGSGVVDVVTSGGDPPRQTLRFVVDVGRLVSVEALSADIESEAEVTVPTSRATVEAVLGGELDPAVAYMRGDLKPEGSSRAFFALLSALARPDCRAVLNRRGPGGRVRGSGR